MFIFALILIGILILAVGSLLFSLGLLFSSKRQKEKQMSFPRLLTCVLLGIGLSLWFVWILGVVHP